MSPAPLWVPGTRFMYGRPASAIGRRRGRPRVDRVDVRLRLDVSYDGTDFSGWAVQPAGAPSPGCCVEALERLVGAERRSG